MAYENVYLNGKVLPAGQATIHVSDAGLLHGASAFTTMYARNGVIFRLEAHLDRLAETVALLNFPIAVDRAELAREAHALLRANQLDEARLRITLTPGPFEAERPTVLITADPLPDYPQWWYEKGVMVVISSLKQSTGDPTFGRKTGCYLPRLLARQEAAAKGAEEALWFTPDGRLAEACFCNVFLVSRHTLCTPPRDTPVLPGVVRQAVIELAGQLGIAVDDQTPLSIHDLLNADELFLTSACAGVRPIVKVERHGVGDGTPGELTGRIMEAYRALLDSECRPASPTHGDAHEG